MLKDKMRAGASVSPLIDNDFILYGVRTYGERVDGYDENIYAKYEIGGAFALKGKVRQYIMAYIYYIYKNFNLLVIFKILYLSYQN